MPKISGNQSSAILKAYKAYPSAVTLNVNTGKALVARGFLSAHDFDPVEYRITRQGREYMEAKDHA